MARTGRLNGTDTTITSIWSLYERRPEAPVSWDGMSGAGVLFYQRLTTAAECGVVAHGLRSIYVRSAAGSSRLSRAASG